MKFIDKPKGGLSQAIRLLELRLRSRVCFSTFFEIQQPLEKKKIAIVRFMLES